MARPARTRIGIRDIKAIKPGEIVWDSSVSGFGARRQTGASVAYVLIYRTKQGRQRWHTIGRHGSPWTPDMARNEAKTLLAEVVQGRDPSGSKREAREGLTVAGLCDKYLEDVEAGKALTRRNTAKKASTVSTDRGRIERHIKPLLGRLKVAAVTSDDVERMMHAITAGQTASKGKTVAGGYSNVRGGAGTASKAVSLLGGIFTYAVKNKLRPDSPVKGVARPPDGERTRRMADAEYAQFAAGLRAAEAAGTWPPAIAAAEFLLLTGWRSGEALGLRWAELDLARRTANLADTKTGSSLRPLGHAAAAILERANMAGDMVFPAAGKLGRMPGFQWHFARIVRFGGLPADITPHVLRHSFASLASDMGYSETTIAALLGHVKKSMTARYVHTADAVLLAAADAVADRIVGLMKT